MRRRAIRSRWPWATRWQRRQHQAEAQAKPKLKPLAKPKPHPQADFPPAPLLPTHPLAAKKSAKAVKPEAVVEEDEEDELETLRGELQNLTASLGAQRASKARAEPKVVAWEAKMDALRAQGEGERDTWAAANLEQARQKVREKDNNIH